MQRHPTVDSQKHFINCISLFSDSLKELFPTGGSIRGCMKGLKALGKYVDLKRMNTTGVSYGCTTDLLVSDILLTYLMKMHAFCRDS